MRRGGLAVILAGFLLVGLGVVPTAEAAKVLLFYSSRYVHITGTEALPPEAQEADNVKAALVAIGHTVTTIAGPFDPVGDCGFGNGYVAPGTLLASADQYRTALAGADVFLIPEHARFCSMSHDITPDVAAVWRNWVAQGGGLIIHMGVEGIFKAPEVLETVFGFQLGDASRTGVDGTGGTTRRTPAAAATRFASGPASLPGNSQTGLVQLASLPPGSISVYGDGTNSSVTIMPYGAGKVIMLGWDWSYSEPPWADMQNGGWFPAVLDGAVAEAMAGPVSRMLVTGPASGAGPEVRIFTDTNGTRGPTAMAYASGFDGGVFVGVGNVVAGGPNIVTGAGAGGGPHVRVLKADGTDAGVSFFAYAPSFTGGVRVAACDVDGDGQDEIITAAGPGGGPHLRVWKITGGAATELGGFFAYAATFTGGVYVACGDLDGDGVPEIVTAADAGGGPHVRGWHLAGGAVTEVVGFFAYAPGFTGGVRVAVADVDGDGQAEIITGAGPGGGPHVRVWSVTGGSVTERGGFFAYAPSFTGGVYVAGGPLDGDPGAEVVTGAGPGGGPHVRIFKPNGQEVGNFFAYDLTFTGGVTVAAGR